jgi:carbon storage regulator
MLNLTVKPGEYFVIGEDIRVIFAGGTANNARVMIDAPRSYNIVRGKVLEQEEMDASKRKKKKYYVEPELPKERIESFIRQQARAVEEG